MSILAQLAPIPAQPAPIAPFVSRRRARRWSLNQVVAEAIATRWSQLAIRTAQPEPRRFFFKECLGARIVGGGYALNLRYSYQSAQCAVPYSVEGYVTGFADGPLTGESWARSCTCPDFQKRRGPARDQSVERCCKHMLLFQVLAASWRKRWPALEAITPRRYLVAGQMPIVREF